MKARYGDLYGPEEYASMRLRYLAGVLDRQGGAFRYFCIQKFLTENKKTKHR